MGLILLSLAVYVVTVLFDQWLDPRHVQMVANRQVLELSMSIDSLEREVNHKDVYIENIRKILSGDLVSDSVAAGPEAGLQSTDLTGSIVPIDSQFRAEFEGTELSNLSINVSTSISELREILSF